MGGNTGGKSSGNQSVQMTPEQQQALAAQTNFMTGTAFPAYQNTIASAGEAKDLAMPAAMKAASNATNVAQQTQGIQQAAGTAGTALGMGGLASLFGPQYKQEQINAALQPGIEQAREANLAQTSQFGGAGSAGSARQALAQENLQGLNAQRMATAAASASSGVEANRAAAAQAMLAGGQNALTGANQAAASQIGYASTPQDVISKYASVVFGTPQGSTTPNFAGTQGSSGSSKSLGAKV